MSFRTSCPSTSSAFQLVRNSLLQAEGLPFSDALSAEHIEQAVQAEGVSFARDGGTGNEPVYMPAVTLWAMLSQALFTEEERSRLADASCRPRLWSNHGHPAWKSTTGCDSNSLRSHRFKNLCHPATMTCLSCNR